MYFYFSIKKLHKYGIVFHIYPVFLIDSIIIYSPDISYGIKTLSTAASDCIASIMARIPNIRCPYFHVQRYKKTTPFFGVVLVIIVVFQN
jgi:hypothetical protein